MAYHYGLYPYQTANIPAGYCNVPTALAATVTGDQVTLDWLKPHDVLYYIVSIYETDTLGGADVALVETVNVIGQRYIKKLSPNKFYRWSVQSVCEVAPLRQSAVVNGDPFATGDYVPVCNPVNVATILVVPSVGELLLQWTAVPDAQSYVVWYRIKGTISYYNQATQTNTATLRILKPGALYEYYIETISKNNLRCQSLVVQYQIPGNTCPQPQPKAVVKDGIAVVAWEDTGALDYDIYLNGLPVVTHYPATMYTFDQLAIGVNHTVSVISNCKDATSLPGTITFQTGATPCGNVTGATFNTITGVIGWDAVPGATAYKVIVNGVSATVPGTSTIVPIVAGKVYNIQIYSYCDTVLSTVPFVINETLPFACPVIADGDVSVTTAPNRIEVDWTDLPGSNGYQYQYEVESSNNLTPAVTVNVSKIVLTDLQPSTAYTIKIKTLCVDGSVSAEYIKTVTTPALLANVKPVIDSIVGITSSAATVNYHLPDGRTQANFRVRLTRLSDNLVAVFTDFQSPYDFTNLTPLTDYSVEVSEIRDGYTQVWSDAVNFTTCAVAVPVGDAVASFNNSGYIDVSYTAAAGAAAYEIWSLFYDSQGNPAFVKEADTPALSYAITNKPWHYRKLRIVAVFTNCGSVSTDIDIACPAVRNLVVDAEGLTANLQWTPIYGIAYYVIKVASLELGIDTYQSTDASFSVPDLKEGISYSITVYAVCVPGNEGLSSNAVVVVPTGAGTPETSCDEPIFEATADIVTGSGSMQEFPIYITSAHFTNATDYDNPVLLGKDLIIYVEEVERDLYEGSGFEMTPTGIRIKTGETATIPNFDASKNDYNLIINSVIKPPL